MPRDYAKAVREGMCWQCEGTKRVRVEIPFPATRWHPACVMITDAPCPRCAKAKVVCDG